MAEAVEQSKQMMITAWKHFLMCEQTSTLLAFRNAYEAHIELYLKALKERN